MLKWFPLLNCACTVFSWYGACFGYQLTSGFCVLSALLDQIMAMTDWSFFYLFVSDAVTTLNPFTYWIDLNTSSSLTSFLLATMNSGRFKHFWSRLVIPQIAFLNSVWWVTGVPASICTKIDWESWDLLEHSRHISIWAVRWAACHCATRVTCMVLVLWGT